MNKKDNYDSYIDGWDMYHKELYKLARFIRKKIDSKFGKKYRVARICDDWNYRKTKKKHPRQHPIAFHVEYFNEFFNRKEWITIQISHGQVLKNREEITSYGEDEYDYKKGKPLDEPNYIRIHEKSSLSDPYY